MGELRDKIAIVVWAVLQKETPSTANTKRADLATDAVLPIVQRHIDAARKQAEADTAAHIAHYVEQAADARDVAVARAEAAEQAVARVRELADKYASYEVTVISGRGFEPSYSGQVVAHDIRRALDGPAEPQEQP